uniref:rRNA N-glycosylase n=1 Tax=Muscari armeniacum TaxID=156613 RepID=Q8LLV7_MUSAR|nr:type 1 ribosome-inactivating protein musarmin le [Muscari armeniacum]
MAASTGMHRLIIFMLIIAAAAGQGFLTVQFTETLDAVTLNRATYTAFIGKIRSRLEDTNVAGVRPNIPVLPVYNQIRPPQGFDIVLTAGAHTTTARFRRDNLYLVGYEMKTDTWLEFGRRRDPQLIRGSEFLGFDGSYTDLERHAGSVTKMDINRAILMTSVQDLTESTTTSVRAKALVVVIQMICEAARFISVENHFASTLATQRAKLPLWMMEDLQKNWARISREVLKWDADTSYKIQPITINRKRITTVEGLRPYLGTLYRATATPSSTSLYDEMKVGLEFAARPFGPVMVA